MKGKKKSSKLLKVVFAFNLLIFIGCGIYVGMYFYEGYKSEDKIDDLKHKMDQLVDSNKNDNSNKRKDGNFTDEDMLEGYRKLRQSEYPDLVGRIIVDDTPIDYYVMQSSKQDPEKYLYADVSGEYNKEGTPFADVKNDLTIPTPNIIIYAHAMLNQHKFGSLNKYKNKDYYEKHKIVKFETMYEPMSEYEVVAAGFSKLYDESNTTDFKYYTYSEISNKEEFDEYVKNTKSMSCYDTGITPKYGDRLITLSTCNDEKYKGGRFFVVAMKKK